MDCRAAHVACQLRYARLWLFVYITRLAVNKQTRCVENRPSQYTPRRARPALSTQTHTHNTYTQHIHSRDVNVLIHENARLAERTCHLVSEKLEIFRTGIRESGKLPALKTKCGSSCATRNHGKESAESRDCTEPQQERAKASCAAGKSLIILNDR